MKKFMGLFISAALLGFAGCSSDGGGTGPETPGPGGNTAGMKIAEGWQHFEASPPDYNAALAAFGEAVSAKSDTAEAYVGRGWSYAFLAVGSNDLKYSSAIADFNRAKTYEPANTDAWAGLALAQYAVKDYNSALSSTNQVLDRDASWVFSHKTDINSVDLHLVRAHVYYFQGKYDLVVEILDLLQPAVVHDSTEPEVLLAQLMELWGS